MIYIYSKELKPKKLFDINLTLDEAMEYTGGNLYIDHPEINPIDCIEVERPQAFQNPIYLNGTIREMTREEDVIINGNMAALQPGEYVEGGKIEVINIPEDGKVYDWDLQQKKWIYNEEKTQEKREKEKQDYFNKIDSIKAEILAYGFDYNGHRQRCRDKDVAFMVATVTALQAAKTLGKDKKITWYFEDNIGVELDLKGISLLMLYGTSFIQSVYDTENYFKNIDVCSITKEMFEEKRKEIHEALVK